MRRAVLVAGIVIALAGLVLVVYTQEVTSPVEIPGDPQGEVLGGFHVLGAETATLRWWGGLASTVVRFYVCFNPVCHGPNSTREVAEGSGASGSLSATVDSSGVYEVNTTGGPALHGSVQVSGLTGLALIGMMILATGGGVGLWSLRRARPAGRRRP